MFFKCLDNPNNIQKDVVISTIPWTDSSIPLMAPASLLPIIESAGFTGKAVDLNVEVYNFTKNHSKKPELVNFFFHEYIDDDIKNIIFEMYKSIAEGILSFKPKIVGLSLFSYVNKHSAKWISYFIKKIDPYVTIIIGGAGCLDTFTGPSSFVQELLDSALVDYHIRGDGETALYEFLIGNRDYLGINTLEWKELEKEELRSLPTPDYRDYIFELYEKSVLPLVGSRGCVRACKFCDYIANWKKFQWRLAEDIFNEMVEQNKKYEIRYFKFQDSLTNGNMKEFKQLIELLSEHNRNNPENSFKWSGYYIFREATPKTSEHWEKLKESGAENLAVGIENLNEHIRYDIGKKFSNKSIDIHLKYAKKHRIRLHLLNIVGYVNETEKDIDFAKQWLRDHTEYKNILHIQWGGTLGIFPNTHLAKNFKSLGLKMIGDSPQSWINEETGSNPEVRARWVQELNDLSRELGYEVADNLDNHFLLETMINDKF